MTIATAIADFYGMVAACSWEWLLHILVGILFAFDNDSRW